MKSGQARITEVTDYLVSRLTDSIKNNTEPIVNTALDIGSRIGKAVIKGIGQALADNPLAKAALGAATGGAIGSVLPGIGTAVGGVIGGSVGLLKHYKDKIFKPDGSHSAGLNYVPRNGYLANLHKGEAVLPQAEAQEYRNGGGKGDIHVTINYSGERLGDREVRDVMNRMVREIKQSGFQMGY